jgi:hypothetical protein
MDTKLELAKQLLEEKKESLLQAQEFVVEANSKFIGKALEKEIKRWNEDASEQEVYIEALAEYIDKIEGQIQQGLDHDADEAKVAELRNEANAMCEHND